ncbi:MAG: retropepsin-like aspartic protease [Burkholderiaceae bacterium]
MQFNHTPQSAEERLAERSVRRTALRGAWGIVAFWLLMLGGMYLVFDRIEARREASLAPWLGEAGELVIPRGRDGHFRVTGHVNGRPVDFLVDTGATLVTISEGLAREAGLRGGRPATFRTANGELPGRVLRAVPVEAGGLSAGGTDVAIGLLGHDESMALLGQSFLYRFDIEIGRDRMILRRRPAS